MNDKINRSSCNHKFEYSDVYDKWTKYTSKKFICVKCGAT